MFSVSISLRPHAAPFPQCQILGEDNGTLLTEPTTSSSLPDTPPSITFVIAEVHRSRALMERDEPLHSSPSRSVKSLNPLFRHSSSQTLCSILLPLILQYTTFIQPEHVLVVSRFAFLNAFFTSGSLKRSLMSNVAENTAVAIVQSNLSQSTEYST
jgi:hypothetical protein